MADGVMTNQGRALLADYGRRGGKTKSLEDMLAASPVACSSYDQAFARHIAQQQAENRLRRQRLYPPEITYIGVDEAGSIDQHIIDRMKYFQAPPKAPPSKRLEDHTNAELVMEMLRRSFAVMPMPGDGGPPDTLR